MARKPSEITPEIVAEHGLSESEYEIILDRLGREPNIMNWVFSQSCGQSIALINPHAAISQNF